jgi:hypothetical protein
MTFGWRRLGLPGLREHVCEPSHSKFHAEYPQESIAGVQPAKIFRPSYLI